MNQMRVNYSKNGSDMLSVGRVRSDGSEILFQHLTEANKFVPNHAINSVGDFLVNWCLYIRSESDPIQRTSGQRRQDQK